MIITNSVVSIERDIDVSARVAKGMPQDFFNSIQSINRFRNHAIVKSTMQSFNQETRCTYCPLLLRNCWESSHPYIQALPNHAHFNDSLHSLHVPFREKRNISRGNVKYTLTLTGYFT